MIIQLSGPISDGDKGKIQANLEAFHAAEERLKKYPGVKQVINTARLSQDEPYEELLMDCLNTISDADILYILPGYQYSPGAKTEIALAEALKKTLIYGGD